MKVKEFNKLVRNRIPTIIQESGRKAIIKTLSDEEFSAELINKRMEEYAELINAVDIGRIKDITEELADLLTVEEAIAKHSPQNIDLAIAKTMKEIQKIFHIRKSKLLKVKKDKDKNKGLFSLKIFLIRTEDD